MKMSGILLCFARYGFAPHDFPTIKLQLPFPLTKWKKCDLHYYSIPKGKGIAMDFHGLQCDANVDFTHWDFTRWGNIVFAWMDDMLNKYPHITKTGRD